LLQAIAGKAAWPPLRNDLQGVVEPEVETVRQALDLLRQAEETLAVAMSGSGPSLFALFSSLVRARSAQEALAERLALGGFDSWCCGFSDRGVSLIT
jgi:4-diphosphocytidyl-2-C-methyl-D-erythritol kinase